MTRAARGMTLRLDEIEVPSTTRPYNATAVVDIKRSIEAIGLQSAPTVIERAGRHLLVAGRHRIEALTRSAPEANGGAKPLRNLENIAAGELARWIKITTPNDRPHVIRMMEEAAAILRHELENGGGP